MHEVFEALCGSRFHDEGHQPVVLPILNEVVLPVELHHGVGQLVAHQPQEGLFGGTQAVAVPGDLAEWPWPLQKSNP